ncbi:AraC family transcriptional regulator [Geodermatophilus sp. TF02-6]|uniref:AraC family transcriptional regulator n=1 Tax=Geodermatophilus sp. TF02-6 TaxID=2250575 RepID=UPI000DEA356E|nr:helix-turn-helix domain-containing protein [Geodermatophilus sp. TF02-6]RBY80596.1 AraC family transcriptional regulator [Geodermatophilus sp. TF02-6]
MLHLRHRVPAPLRPFVAEAHGYRAPANPFGVHRGLPSRHLTLVVELAAPLRVSGLGADVAAHAVVGGLHTRPALIDATRAQDGVQYGLTPSAAAALLGVPAAELGGRAVDLAAVLGRTADRLVDDLATATSWAQRFARLDAALLDRLSGTTPAVRPEVREAWRMVLTSDGRRRTGELAAHVGWSRRHLAAQFRLATGLTPTQAARIARFEAARRLLQDPLRPPLADVAARCGYADQPHLAREWRALAGCSVGTWLREELPFVQDDEVFDPAPSPA